MQCQWSLMFSESYIIYMLMNVSMLCCQVAMGQGQAEIAMQLIQECSRNGEWLGLKNLHLVTAWLPTLEKVTKKLIAATKGI